MPINERLCKYCSMNEVDDEHHFWLRCDTFTIKRNCLFGMLSSINHNFLNQNNEQKLCTLMCPSNVKSAKLINKFADIIFSARKRLDNGYPINIGEFTDQFIDESDNSGSED